MIQAGSLEAVVSFNMRRASVSYGFSVRNPVPRFGWSLKCQRSIEQRYAIKFCAGLVNAAVETLAMNYKMFISESRQLEVASWQFAKPSELRFRFKGRLDRHRNISTAILHFLSHFNGLFQFPRVKTAFKGDSMQP